MYSNYFITKWAGCIEMPHKIHVRRGRDNKQYLRDRHSRHIAAYPTTMSDFASLLGNFKQTVEKSVKQKQGKKCPRDRDASLLDNFKQTVEKSVKQKQGKKRPRDRDEYVYGTAPETRKKGVGSNTNYYSPVSTHSATGGPPVKLKKPVSSKTNYYGPASTHSATGDPSIRQEEKMTSIWSALNNVPVGTLTDNILISAINKTMEIWTDKLGWTGHEAELAESILFRMEKEEKRTEQTLPLQYYVSVMNAWAKCTSRENVGLRAENILKRMDARVQSEGRTDLKPTRFAINTCIGAYARGATPQRYRAAEDAERLLGRLERDFQDSGNIELRPSVRSYSKVIDAWAGAGCPERAMEVLERMGEQFRSGNIAAKPNTTCCTSVLDALAKGKQGRPQAEQAEAILRRMLGMFHDGHKELKPDTVQFGPVLDAWAKSGDQDAAQKARGILELMKRERVQPDVTSYNIVINVLANDGRNESLKEAETILHELEVDPRLMADTFSYNTVLKAYSKNAQTDLAEKLARHWHSEYKRRRTKYQPDVYTYSNIINAWARSYCEDAGSKAESILNWMEENGIIPNSFCYNACINAYSRSTHADDAERLFERLESKYRSTKSRDLKPDHHSYFGLVSAFARSSRPEKAERYLRDMVKRGFKPGMKCFNSVLTSWARSGQSCSYTRTTDLLSFMFSLGVTPDTLCYNTAINSLVQSGGNDKAERSFEMLQQMHSNGVGPSSVTYSLLVQTCTGGKPESFDRVFRECIKDGMLDKIVAGALSEHGPESVRKQLNVDKFPESWTRNANRGPDTLSKKRVQQLQSKAKSGGGGNVKNWGWRGPSRAHT
jgi:pentatricopeptide repeat protein